MTRTLEAPTRQRRKEARPLELLTAALALFVEKGFAATRAEEVAHLAGVSKGTLYLYYPSKEELLKAVIEQFLSSEIAAGAALIEQHQGSMSELMREVLTPWWLRVFDSPASGVFKLIITEVRNFPEIAEFYFHRVVEPGHKLIGQVIEQGIARGEFRPVEVESAVHSVLLPMVMICLHKHSLGACAPIESLMDPRGFIAAHIDLVVRGLATTPIAPAAAPTGRARRKVAP